MPQLLLEFKPHYCNCCQRRALRTWRDKWYCQYHRNIEISTELHRDLARFSTGMRAAGMTMEEFAQNMRKLQKR